MSFLLKADGYDIHVSDDLSRLSKVFSFKKYSKVVILTDENSRAYCLPILMDTNPALKAACVIEIPQGEEFKNIDTCSRLWKSLFEENMDRKALWVNLGGGVISDLGGFVALTYKRGIDFINIPTTLLSQVDATIGGKLGIDFEGIKNGVGLFENPETVFIHPEFLKTLPKKELLSGFAEIIKHALIANKNYWKSIVAVNPVKVKDWTPFIIESLKIKHEIVQKDPYEKNVRKLLNFGHTFGHALESTSLAAKGNSKMFHGHAVAMGMIAETYLSRKLSGLPEKDLDSITEFILKIYRPYFNKKMINNKLISWMRHDKKNERESFNFTLLQSIGNGKIDFECSADEVKEAADYLKSCL